MNIAYISGYVYDVVSDNDFVVVCDGDYIHCKSKVAPRKGETIAVLGTLKSERRTLYGKPIITHYIETNNMAGE